MRRWFVVAAGAVVLSSAGLIGQNAQQVAAGQKLFADLGCAKCHSIEGKGAKIAPLDGVGSKLTAAEIRMWLTDPPAMMAKLPKKPLVPMRKVDRPDADLDALVAYLQTRKKK